MAENRGNQRFGWDELVYNEYQRLLVEKNLKNSSDLKQRSKKIFEALQPRPHHVIDKRQMHIDDAPVSIELSAIKKLPTMKTCQFINRNVQGVIRTTLDYMPYLKDELACEMEEELREKYSIRKNKIQDLLKHDMLVKLVNKCYEKRPEIGMPPSSAFFKTVKKMLGSSTDSREIRKRFTNSVAGTSIKLTAARAENQDRVSVLKSHFCRVCFLYGCKSHVATPMPTDFEKLKFWEKERKESCKKAGICSDDCYKLKVATGRAAEWTEEEIYYFKTARKSQRDHFCGIAKFIPTRTCQEVFEYAQKGQKLAEPQPDKGFELWPMVKPKNKCHKALYKQHCKSRNNIEERPTITEGSSSRTSQAQAQTSIAENILEEISKYVPCDHGGPCDSTCPCVVSGNRCEKLCRCSFLGSSFVCGNRFPGCQCQVCGLQCVCRIANRECDPDSCKCKIEDKFATENAQGGKFCTNRGMQLNQGKHLLLAVSDIPNAGYGCFTKDAIAKGEFITEYRGELLPIDEADRRAIVYSMAGTSYIFGLDNQTLIDAAHKGNKIRFANNDRFTPNFEPTTKMVNGERRVGMYALRNIEAEEELLFNYGEKYPDEMVGGTESDESKSNAGSHPELKKMQIAKSIKIDQSMNKQMCKKSVVKKK